MLHDHGLGGECIAAERWSSVPFRWRAKLRKDRLVLDNKGTRSRSEVHIAITGSAYPAHYTHDDAYAIARGLLTPFTNDDWIIESLIVNAHDQKDA